MFQKFSIHLLLFFLYFMSNMCNFVHHFRTFNCCLLFENLTPFNLLIVKEHPVINLFIISRRHFLRRMTFEHYSIFFSFLLFCCYIFIYSLTPNLNKLIHRDLFFNIRILMCSWKFSYCVWKCTQFVNS